MESITPYFLKIYAELQQVARWQYFEPIAAAVVFLLFFIIGRKSYESKFSHVLNTINDCENQKTRLRDQIKKRNQSLHLLTKQITLFQIISAVIIVLAAAYTYFKKFQPLIVGAATLGLTLMWGFVLARRKYLQMMLIKSKDSLQKKQMSSQNDSKQILGLLGEQVCKQLKTKFQRELQVQWRSQELKECDLKRCYDEKNAYKELHKLYMDIMAEMRKMQWCETCSQMLNVDANEIKASELETRVRGYKAVSEKLSLEKKKELTNKLLEEWQFIDGKLPFMCRRGCCVRFRHSLDEIKKANHDRLKALKNKIALLK